MTPHTVPNNPTKGATDATVARNVIRFSSNVSCAVALRCKHCGKEEVFSDRDVAIAALNGAILCSNCEGEPDDTYADPNTILAYTTERDAVLHAYAIDYYGEKLLELVTHSPVGSVAAALLTTHDAATLYHALGSWIRQHRPDFLTPPPPVSDDRR